MKKRWCFRSTRSSLALSLAATSVLFTAALIAAALLAPDVGAAPPAKPLTPVPGVAAVAGTPGTITFTQYAADGVTVLDVSRLPATAADTSASVAARLGKSAPAPSRGGVVTPADVRLTDAATTPTESSTRPREVASATRSRDAAIAKRLERATACCSSTGCGELQVSRDVTSSLFGSWLGTFNHRVYWCWNYPRITNVSVGCWSDVDGFYIVNRGCNGWSSFYNWRNDNRGGFVSYRQGDWGNCIFTIGCVKNIYPWIEIWINGNGAWAQDQGG